MKNECQKDGLPRDPLIFVAPTLNFVTILSVGWLDNIGRTVVFRENADDWNSLVGDSLKREKGGRPTKATSNLMNLLWLILQTDSPESRCAPGTNAG